MVHMVLAQWQNPGGGFTLFNIGFCSDLHCSHWHRQYFALWTYSSVELTSLQQLQITVWLNYNG
jgi:hypothetical protein